MGVNAQIADSYDTLSTFFKITNTVPPFIIRNLMPLKYRD
jgi:hypothetical protein